MERIIIFGGNGIELVVMTESARHSQTEKTFGNHINSIIDNIVLHSHEPVAQSQKTERGEVRRVASGCWQFIRRNLFQDKHIVGLILVETVDDVISIGPGKWIIPIFAVALNLAFGVAIAS